MTLHLPRPLHGSPEHKHSRLMRAGVTLQKLMNHSASWLRHHHEVELKPMTDSGVNGRFLLAMPGNDNRLILMLFGPSFYLASHVAALLCAFLDFFFSGHFILFLLLKLKPRPGLGRILSEKLRGYLDTIEVPRFHRFL